MLNLMYITNDPAVACIAQAAGVQRIFVDMESLGKGKRQGGMDTVAKAKRHAATEEARGALGRLRAQAADIPEMDPVEINAEIAAARAEKADRARRTTPS